MFFRSFQLIFFFFVDWSKFIFFFSFTLFFFIYDFFVFMFITNADKNAFMHKNMHGKGFIDPFFIISLSSVIYTYMWGVVSYVYVILIRKFNSQYFYFYFIESGIFLIASHLSCNAVSCNFLQCFYRYTLLLRFFFLFSCLFC